VYKHNLAVFKFPRKHSVESLSSHFLIYFPAVVSIIPRTVRDSSSDPDRASHRAVAGTASAFLLPRFLAGAGDFSTSFSMSPRMTSIAQHRSDYLVNE